jgi:NADPH:quinone reductase-like Zn-dependent oxidoreductase
MTDGSVERRAAYARRPGAPDVLEVDVERLPPPKSGEVLVRVEAVGLNHVETLIRADTYSIRIPFPYAVGFEGAGVVVAAGPDVDIKPGARVCVRRATDGRGASAVFDPVGAATYRTNLQFLAPRGCLINYGQLSGALPPIELADLMDAGSVFVTKYGPRAGLVGRDEVGPFVSEALTLASKWHLTIGVAAQFTLDRVVDAYARLESHPDGKVLILPHGA